MCNKISICDGAFNAELVKGENGKESWQYTPNLNKIGKKPKQKGNWKEKPQFKVIEQIEEAATNRFKQNTKSMILDTTKFLKTLIK